MVDLRDFGGVGHICWFLDVRTGSQPGRRGCRSDGLQALVTQQSCHATLHRSHSFCWHLAVSWVTNLWYPGLNPSMVVICIYTVMRNCRFESNSNLWSPHEEPCIQHSAQVPQLTMASKLLVFLCWEGDGSEAELALAKKLNR